MSHLDKLLDRLHDRTEAAGPVTLSVVSVVLAAGVIAVGWIQGSP